VIYHPGGLTHDGEALWVSVSEYRPEGTSIVYRVELRDREMEAVEVFRFDDHLGALVYDRDTHTLHGVSWGSRRFYRWELDGADRRPTEPGAPRTVRRTSFYVDYQDCHDLPGPLALCGGVARYAARALGEGQADDEVPIEIGLGGLELVDLERVVALRQVPVPLWVSPTLPMTQNPFFPTIVDGELRFYFVPEDDEARLFVCRAGPRAR